MSTSKIGDFSIHFGADGEEQLKADLAELKRAMEDMAKAGEKVPQAMKTAYRELSREVEGAEKAQKSSKKTAGEHKESMENAGSLLGKIPGLGKVGSLVSSAASGPEGLALAGASVVGDVLSGIADKLGAFVMRGVESSAEFEVLNQHLDRLSRIVGGVLSPVMDGFDEILTDMEPSLRNISDVVGDGIGHLTDLFVDLAEAMIPLIELTTELLKEMNNIGTAKHAAHELTPKGGGFEQVTDLFKRLQTAGMKGGGPAKSDNQHLEEMNANIDHIFEAFGLSRQAWDETVKWLKDTWNKTFKFS